MEGIPIESIPVEYSYVCRSKPASELPHIPIEGTPIDNIPVEYFYGCPGRGG